MVMVNLPTAGVDYHVPFGGRKGSSYGPREQGRYAREFYTVVRPPTRCPELGAVRAVHSGMTAPKLTAVDSRLAEGLAAGIDQVSCVPAVGASDAGRLRRR